MILSQIQQAELAAAGFDHLQWGEPLCKGTSNQNVRVSANGTDWVLRVNNPLTQSLCPRENEVRCWRLATAAGIAPELVFVSSDHQIYLSRFIAQPHPWDQSYRHHPQAVALLDRLLSALAALPLPSHRVTPGQQWQYYQTALRGRLPHLDSSLRDVADQILAEDPWMHASVARLAHNQTTRFCHRDLNPNNLLLVDNKLLSIDFEYACASDPRLELAALLACHRLTNAQARKLQQRHLAGPVQQQTLDFADACYCYWVFTAAWGVIMCSDGKAALSWLREALGHLHHHKARLPD